MTHLHLYFNSLYAKKPISLCPVKCAREFLSLCMTAVLLTFSTTIEAALPPLYQSLKEFETLLADQQIISKLNASEAIVDIKKEEQEFVITTTKQTITAEIIFEPIHPIQWSGPAKFHIEFRSSKPNDLNQEK